MEARARRLARPTLAWIVLAACLASSAWAVEVDCDNGFDDDFNGATDCDDRTCADDPHCGEADCVNGIDDDADGDVDCADANCSDDPLCGEQVCNNALDDDGDTLVDCFDGDCADDAPCIHPLTVRGRVVWDDGTGPVPVACCVVEVTLTNLGSPRFTSRATATSRSDGTFSVALDCGGDPSGIVDVTVHPLCCGGTSSSRQAGCPTSPLDVGDVGCLNAPIVNRTVIAGSVSCRRGPFLEPVEGCSILVEGIATPPTRQFTSTDALGNWEICVPCGPGSPAEYDVTAQCCGATRRVTMATGCPRVDLPPFTCSTCPPLLCPNRDQVQVSGMLACQDPGRDGIFGTGDDVELPVDGCTVWLVTFGYDTDGDGYPDNCGPAGVTTAVTGADGRYVACVRSPVEPDCGNATWQLEMLSCCGASTARDVQGRPPAIDLGTELCGRPCRGDCAPGVTQIHGRVTCRDPSGAHVGVSGCNVLATCTTSVSTSTDSNGYYTLCFPDCASCGIVQVTAPCCGAIRTVDVSGCPLEVTANLDCSDCASPPRPCPPDGMGNEQTEMTGLVVCRSPGHDTPVGGCDVHLRWYASGDPTRYSEADAVTDGSGRYTACVACGSPAGPTQDVVEVTSRCCTGSSSTPLLACPPAATLAQVTCTDCAPCPPDGTRLQGKVICRGGGPVGGCPIVATVDTCSGVRVYTALTDAQGRYQLCVPCPCPRGSIRVDATCCGASRTLVPRRCGRTTPVPTLFCGAPCR